MVAFIILGPKTGLSESVIFRGIKGTEGLKKGAERRAAEAARQDKGEAEGAREKEKEKKCKTSL